MVLTKPASGKGGQAVIRTTFLLLIMFSAVALPARTVAEWPDYKDKQTFIGKYDQNTGPIITLGILQIVYEFKAESEKASFAIIVRRIDSPLDEEYVLQIYGTRKGHTYYYGPPGLVYLRIGGAGKWGVSVQTTKLPTGLDRPPASKSKHPSKPGDSKT